MPDFGRISANHVRMACLEILQEGVPRRRRARTTFALFQGHRLPAKYVVARAYRIATGQELAPDRHSGGLPAVKLLKELGFHTEHAGELSGPGSRGARRRRSNRRSRSATAQFSKVRLRSLLKREFGCVEMEATFDWLVVPEPSQLTGVLADIHDRLEMNRGQAGFDTPGHRLRVDYHLPTHRTLVEYDERQHFTLPRALSLRAYPIGLTLGFDVQDWIRRCEHVRGDNHFVPHVGCTGDDRRRDGRVLLRR